jgi:hypothetical protein
MKKLLLYAFAAACSGLLGATFLWVTGDSVTTWVGMGYLFVFSIWLASWFTRRPSKATRSKGQWAAQIAISLLWWPVALLSGFVGLFAAQPFALSPIIHSLFMYGTASVVAIGLGLLSLRIDGAKLSSRFLSVLVFANVIVLGVALLVYNHFQAPPFRLSDHYEVWLILMVFVPLAAVNGAIYGFAFPEIAKPFDSASGD